MTITLTNTNANAAQLVTQAGGAQTRTATINAGTPFSPLTVNTGGFAFDPLQAGSTIVSATAADIGPKLSASVAVTVTP